MSLTIQIQGTIIDFPTAGSSPDWAQAVDAFAVAVQNALASVVGPADIPPQVFVIDSYNPGTNVNIPNLTFSTSIVRSAFIRYAVYRSTNSTTAFETGELTIIYNPNGGVGSKWEQNRHGVINDAQVTFSITDTGQVQLSTVALAGTSHSGKVTFTAQALLQNE